MVISLGPGKFYGSSLPRPRYYTDIKFNTDRVDPPVPVMDPFLSWATEAHWSMGGLSFNRLRMQGRIEGSIDKLRKQRDHKEPSGGDSKLKGLADWSDDENESESEDGVGSDEEPPRAPVADKRRKRVLLEEGGPVKKLARKLNNEFDRVSRGLRDDDGESEDSVKSKKGKKSLRSSSRLAKKKVST